MTQVPTLAATEALKAANAHMHHAMDIELTGDPDADFVRSMIPHHEGAIEMARIVIEHGSDPKVLQLAQRIVADQEREITQMQRWLEEKRD